MARRIKLRDEPRFVARVVKTESDVASCDIISRSGPIYRTEDMFLTDAEDWVLNTAEALKRLIDEIIYLNETGEDKDQNLTSGIFAGKYYPSSNSIIIHIDGMLDMRLFRGNSPDRFVVLSEWSNELSDTIQEYIDDTLDNL